ncbi:hypothetical protein HDV01_003446 [Terramyces sp. JEL0728]|nr:hypothetical protein HDV01_003446 [Terramyces sp. JEL0728]
MERNLKQESQEIFTEYNSRIRDLFESFENITLNKEYTSPASITDEIIRVDKRLDDLLSRISEHQQIQSRINQYKQSLFDVTKTNMKFAQDLNSSYNELELLLFKAKRILSTQNEEVVRDEQVQMEIDMTGTKPATPEAADEDLLDLDLF